MRRILVLETYIAGVQIEQHGRIKALPAGGTLTLRRERSELDHFAIAVIDGEDRLGWVPRTVNAMPARMLDAGISLDATFVEWSHHGSRFVAEIHLHMVDGA